MSDKNHQDEQNKKNILNKEQTAEKMKVRCKICFKETSPNPKCFGHGSGIVAASDAGQVASNGGESSLKAQLTDRVAKTENTETQTTDNGNDSPQADLPFKPETISELLNKKLLVINNDSDTGVLTIRLQCKPSMLSDEQRNELKKFVDIILNEVEAFKNENRISSSCITLDKDKEGNFLALRIMLPTPTLYDAFIQRLANKNLLPMKNIEQKEKMVYEEGGDLHLSPLAMKPTPAKNTRFLQLRDEVGKSASIRPRSILDGLKPKGWE